MMNVVFKAMYCFTAKCLKDKLTLVSGLKEIATCFNAKETVGVNLILNRRWYISLQPGNFLRGFLNNTDLIQFSLYTLLVLLTKLASYSLMLE